jgi:CRISPR-associated protein Cmr6
MEYPIPKKSVEAWHKHQAKSGQNPGLVFDRFAPDWRRDSTLKKSGLEAVRAAATRIDGSLLTSWNARWEATVRGVHSEPFSLRTDWRFVPGLGRKGSLEAGFTFNRYGFPVLPGSSVKGVARASGFFEIAQKSDTSDLKQLEEALSADGESRRKYGEWRVKVSPEARAEAAKFREIFGTTAVAGCAVFFDAIPAATRLPELELDIMNPHFPDYYGDKTGKTAPTDWQSPRPVYFLTVAPNTEFRFAIGWRQDLNDEGRRLRDQAKDWLVKGLTEFGAGAKTSAGYGYFLE